MTYTKLRWITGTKILAKSLPSIYNRYIACSDERNDCDMADPSALINPITAKLFAKVAQRLESSLRAPTAAIAVAALAKLEGYAAYLEETTERVSTFKSFANPVKPVSLIDHFTEMRLQIGNSDDSINQDGLIDLVDAPSRTIVSASAGFGKSMLMRYIAYCMYNSPTGRIPLFIELRHLNRMRSPELLTYIHASYNRLTSVERKAFDQNLDNGVFCFILDGFDELNHDMRRDVESQILDIAHAFPKNSFVVSGRPDERFEAWRTFSLLRVMPMSKDQVIELIHKLEFDRGTKKRFLNKIRSDNLYESHTSFLSTPLLAILMLLTFEENANIPDKMHLFYAKAFDTLFHKHDALKEQYDRERKSGALIDEFSKIFSVFCLNTYIEEKVEFNETELLKYIKNAISYYKSDVKQSDLLFDLVESVCLLNKEGLSYFFVHRSFQEYFTARFLATCPEEIRDEFIDKVCFRFWDNVLSMLFDMASDQIEPTWVEKNLTNYFSQVGHKDDLIPPVLARFNKIWFRSNGGSEYLWTIDRGMFAKFFATMNEFYGTEFAAADLMLDIDKITKLRAGLPGYQNALDSAVEGDNEYGIEGKLFSVDLDHNCLEWLESVGIVEFANKQFNLLSSIKKKLKSDLSDRNKFLKSLFS